MLHYYYKLVLNLLYSINESLLLSLVVHSLTQMIHMVCLQNIGLNRYNFIQNYLTFDQEVLLLVVRLILQFSVSQNHPLPTFLLLLLMLTLRHAVLLVAVDFVILFCERRTLAILLDVVGMLPNGSTCIALALLLLGLFFVLVVFAITCIALLGFIDCDIFYSLKAMGTRMMMMMMMMMFEHIGMILYSH